MHIYNYSMCGMWELLPRRRNHFQALSAALGLSFSRKISNEDYRPCLYMCMPCDVT